MLLHVFVKSGVAVVNPALQVLNELERPRVVVSDLATDSDGLDHERQKKAAKYCREDWKNQLGADVDVGEHRPIIVAWVRRNPEHRSGQRARALTRLRSSAQGGANTTGSGRARETAFAPRRLPTAPRATLAAHTR